VENISLLSNARDNGFVGVNLYADDEGAIRGLPRNMRASEIAHCCGKPLEVWRRKNRWVAVSALACPPALARQPLLREWQ
jgi:hypothetical protein